MEKLSLEKFEEAAEKVKEVTLQTNLVYSEYFSNQTCNKVYLKPENMQYTGAYKVRGAYYKISTMSEEEREKGLITASIYLEILPVVTYPWCPKYVAQPLQYIIAKEWGRSQ